LTAVCTAYPTPPFLPVFHPPIELASWRPRGRPARHVKRAGTVERGETVGTDRHDPTSSVPRERPNGCARGSCRDDNILLDLRGPSHPASIPPRRHLALSLPDLFGVTVTVVNRSDEPKRVRVLGDELVLSEGISPDQ
jgi:hypothetical protein